MSDGGSAGEAASIVEVPAAPEEWRLALPPLSLAGLAQLAAAAAVGLAGIKLFAVGGGDPALAVAILEHVGYLSALVSIGIQLLPVLLMVLILRLYDYRAAAVEARRPNDSIARWAWPVILWTALVLLSIAAWWFTLIVAALVVGNALLDRRWRRRAREVGERAPTVEDYLRVRRRAIMAEGLSLVAVLVISATTRPDMWLPSEMVEADGTEVTGYVLSVRDQWMTVLRTEPRELVYLPVDEVEARTMCARALDRRTLLEFVARVERETAGRDCS